MRSLAARTAVVTGAGPGIGAASSEVLPENATVTTSTSATTFRADPFPPKAAGPDKSCGGYGSDLVPAPAR
jgi:NAD(P)-dependent dehydrogenase (short-subunit alcohol dehydrogenase family)